MPEYNPLYDANLANYFFSNHNKLYYLKKQGIIKKLKFTKKKDFSEIPNNIPNNN